MGDGFTRILQDARELFEGIQRYQTTTPHDVSLFRDAYTKFYRLKERFTKESNNKTLDPIEEKALKELFDERLITDIMEIRKIGDHTEKTRGGYLEEGWKKVEQALARAATGSYCKNRKRW